MDIKQHIGFRNEQVPELVSYLRAHNIRFSDHKFMSSLEMLESDPHWKMISHYISMYGIAPITETVFSKEELSKSEWLCVRSTWRNGYPQPEKDFGYEELTYSRRQCCKECGCGLVQIDSFRLKKQPNWGRRHFFQLNWVGDELFTNDSAKAVFENKQISGTRFRYVKNKNGTEELDGVYQLDIPFLFKKGMDSEQMAIKKTYSCPKCGEIKYVHSGRGPYIFRKEVFNNAPDVVKTQEMFGDGHYATRLILVRRKVYQTITDNNLDRGLFFQIVKLV